jgi:hypothetical protein
MSFGKYAWTLVALSSDGADEKRWFIEILKF